MNFLHLTKISSPKEQGFPRLIADDFPGVEKKLMLYYRRLNVSLFSSSIFTGFFCFFSGSSQFEFDPNAKMVTCILKSNNWLYC
ncbi:hypothetical protein HPG69_018500 [Diceros bicornis minor]|uniref:Uncharacterized protein n=1 Tax=Diceros bicornis minor TaxID=77932 RepID=A0A7J7EZ77_DICBM|nr:hypothetical protein HPG69_018500 [Diceros bicornis minor]